MGGFLAILGLIAALLVPHAHLQDLRRVLNEITATKFSPSSSSEAPSPLGLKLNIHRNGEYGRCHKSPFVLDSLDRSSDNVYSFDSAFTSALLSSPDVVSGCDPVVGDGTFRHFCDMGPEKTPVLHDHNSLVPVRSTQSLPCSFFTREGVRIKSLSSLEGLVSSSSSPVDIYAVAAGRIFQFAPGYVGEIFNLSHVPHPENKKISLETMSVSPKVFDVKGFFVEAEADDIVKRAQNQQSESHKLKRSSTGVDGYKPNPIRTSENAFDTHGKSAMQLKKRCFQVLGMDHYRENMADGLQILRYNVSTAYKSHLDWIDPSPGSDHDFISAGVGSNRYATILLYMVDLEEDEGGETVFSYGDPYKPTGAISTYEEALREVKNLKLASLFKENSWEEKMVAECKSQLSVTPKRARSVLFYSQHPDGRVDKRSKHGGCPVLTDQKSKWASNLWVWNAPRMGYSEAPTKSGKEARAGRRTDEHKSGGHENAGKKSRSANPSGVSAVFKNTGKDSKFDDSSLFYEDAFWGKFGPGQQHNVNSFKGHVWNVKDEGGNVLLTWIVGEDSRQKFEC